MVSVNERMMREQALERVVELLGMHKSEPMIQDLAETKMQTDPTGAVEILELRIKLAAAEAKIAAAEAKIAAAPCSPNCASLGGWRVVGPCDCWKSKP